MKPYKAIFFDWDGTAVLSRKAPVDQVIGPMKELLKRGVKLVIVSGTTYENIAGGQLHKYFSPEELSHLYLGLGRGAYNYRFDGEGMPYVWKSALPDNETLLTIHDVCYGVHRKLLADYGISTDIVFSRPNYCKVDLMVENDRGDNLFMQENEGERLRNMLTNHGFKEGLSGLLKLSCEIAKEKGLSLSATTDAKYLEIGPTGKNDNVDTIMTHLMQEYEILPEECSFWGDEYVGCDEGIFGSDSFMLTPLTEKGEFFDVSSLSGTRPEKVVVLGGGVDRFISFLLHTVSQFQSGVL